MIIYSSRINPMKENLFGNGIQEKISTAWEKFAEHEHRPDVGGEHKYGDILQGLLLLLFITVSIIDYFFLKTRFTLTPYIPLWVRIFISLLLLFTGWRLAKSGMQLVFGELREKPSVIYQGAFTQTRHPIYLGAILLYLTVVALTLSLAAGAVWVVTIVCYAFLAKHEEKLLIEKFGEEYRGYMQQVPMWIPRPKT